MSASCGSRPPGDTLSPRKIDVLSRGRSLLARLNNHRKAESAAEVMRKAAAERRHGFIRRSPPSLQSRARSLAARLPAVAGSACFWLVEKETLHSRTARFALHARPGQQTCRPPRFSRINHVGTSMTAVYSSRPTCAGRTLPSLLPRQQGGNMCKNLRTCGDGLTR